MTAEIIQAQYDTLEEIANRFNQLQDNSENMTRALTQHVGKLQNGGWQGLGSESFFD